MLSCLVRVADPQEPLAFWSCSRNWIPRAIELRISASVGASTLGSVGPCSASPARRTGIIAAETQSTTAASLVGMAVRLECVLMTHSPLIDRLADVPGATFDAFPWTLTTALNLLFA